MDLKELNDLADKLQELELTYIQEDELCDTLYDVDGAMSTLQHCYRRLLKLNSEVDYE